MKFKAIALDLDGTLKSTDKVILPKTKNILMELARRGVIIILASGRPTKGLVAEAMELQLDTLGGYLLSFNGASVIEFKTSRSIYQKTLSVEQAHKMYDHGKKYNLNVITYNDQNIITEDFDDRYVIQESSVTTMDISRTASFKDAVTTDVNKLLMTGEPEYVASILDEFVKPFEDELSIYRSEPYFVEVMSKGIDKGASLQALLDDIGLTKEELVAFGDGYNDLSMIEFAGMGVAMGNAVDEVKQRANAITSSNNEEGIFNTLQDLVMKGLI